MASKKRAAVKVVIVDTQYVETDPKSFKSVVQKLTGKDCSVEWIQESSCNGENRELSSSVDDKLENDVVDNKGSSSVSMLAKGMSFKYLDRLILELPPMEELQWSWTDQYNLH